MGKVKKNKHIKSSAVMVSVAIHAIIILGAASFVAVHVYVKEDQTFEAKSVKRPKMQLKKLTVPVKMEKKKVRKPKMRKTIISRPKTKSVAFKMPEISGIKGGTGYMDGGGLGSIGFGLDIDLFGGDNGSGNELEGTFFDLKMNPDKTPRKMDNQRYKDAIKNFVGSWKISRFEKKYFKAPKKKYATTFMLPSMNANEAPKAYGVDKVVKPKYWAAYYTGRISAPETGRYRFWGCADDLLIVRINSDMVLDGTRKGTVVTNWKSKDKRNEKYTIAKEKIKIGDWFKLTKGESVEMEVLVGERPGGLFNCSLLIEQGGVSYPKGKGGMPILPIFKTVDIPEKLIPKMKLEKGTCTPEGPSFGVLK